MTKLAHVFLVLLVVLLLLALRGCGGVRAGTYNIRRFGVEPTDLPRLAAIVEESGADVLALQEIEAEAAPRALAARLSRRGRSFVVALSTCGGKSGMRVGFLYDETRVRLVGTREFRELEPEGGACSTGERPGLAGTFADARTGRAFTLLAVHLQAGSAPDRLAIRKEQWRRALALVKRLEADGLGPVALLGDTNSTGFLDDRGGERTFILDSAARASVEVLTRGLACSEYYGPLEEGGPLVPSLLDHVVSSPGLARASSVRVHGQCAALACRPAATAPREHVTVSDHCPVTFDVTP